MKRILLTIRQLTGWRFDLYLLFTLAQALLPVASALIARTVVDKLVTHDDWTNVLTLVTLEALVVAGQVAVSQVIVYLDQELRYSFVQGIQHNTASQAAAMDLAFFEDPEQCNLLYRIRQESYRRPLILFGYLGRVLAGVITLVGFFVVIVTWQPLLAALFLVGIIPLLRWGQRAAGWSWMSHDLSTSDGRWSAYFEGLLCEREAAKEVRLFHLAPLVLPRLREYDTKHRRTQMKGHRKKTLYLIPGQLIGVIAQYASVALAAFQVIQHELSLGQFTLVIAALASCRQILQGIVAEYIEIQEQRHFFKELFAFWDLQPAITSPEYPVPVAPLQKALRFEQLSFRYPGTDRWVLRDIEFEIPQGGSVAIVGLNGAGKTTLIKLLARLYEPTEGRILWDNTDIADLDVVQYRQQLSIVFQDFVQYQLSLKENITMSTALQYEPIWFGRVLGFLGLQQAVDTMKDGIETLLGRQFHVHGVELSGGQWQRVAVARALYKTASILVLDEPTSAMDAQQEAELYNSIHEWKGERTLILISHRLSSVRHCDTIIVLDEGRIAEIGDHNTLMKKQGMYQQLFEVQAQGYSPLPVDETAS